MRILRWRGWDVKYLGEDLKLDRLEDALTPIHPQLLLFTATRPETASSLSDLPAIVDREITARPQPCGCIGAFRDASAVERSAQRDGQPVK